MRFILLISIVQSVLWLSHWLLYRTFVSFYGVTHPVKLWGLRILIGLLSVSFVGSSFLSFRYASLPVRSCYVVSATWLGVSYLLFLASLWAWAFEGLSKLFHLSIDRKILVTILFGLAMAGSLFGWVNARMIRIQTLHLPLPHLPAPWAGRTAVWVSDIHLGHVRDHRFAQQITKTIQNLKADIVFIGGDLFDGGGAMDLHRMVAPFSELSPPLGTYFITGNHEEFYDSTPYLEAVRRAKISVLDNEKVEIEGLQIIGVGYRASKNRDRFKALLQKMAIDPERPSLLLKHAPSDLEIARDHGISAQISGHTHRGQVFLFRFITSLVYKGYDYGLKRFGDLIVYTSSGVGTWGPPMRLDTLPEIVVIRFVRED